MVGSFPTSNDYSRLLRNTLAYNVKDNSWQNSFIFPIPGRAPAPGGNFIKKNFFFVTYTKTNKLGYLSWQAFVALCEALKCEVNSSQGQTLQFIILEP